ncbi:MAG: hypothetical protein ABSF61_05240 [Anaerolineales bacterium]|jgi:hypothetical protein
MRSWISLAREAAQCGETYAKIVPTTHGARVQFTDARHQRIFALVTERGIEIDSVVIGAVRAQELGLLKVLLLACEDNHERNLVEFLLDRRRRLVGRIRIHRTEPGADELAYCITRLARECDRMEYQLSGRDIE